MNLAQVLATNIVGLLIVVFRRDLVWCVGATWLDAALIAQRPKPFPVYVGIPFQLQTQPPMHAGYSPTLA
jgi:hypothetical protein